MTDYLSGAPLLSHVRALADGIGPRPAGHPAEAQARAYIRRCLNEIGIADVEDFSFPTPDTWGYSLIAPVLLGLVGNAVGGTGWLGCLIGGAAALAGAYEYWQGTVARPQMLYPLYPKREDGGTVLARVAPAGEVRHKVLLIGHTDTNKARQTSAPRLKRTLQASVTLLLGGLALNGLVLWAQLLGVGERAERVRRLTALLLAVGLGSLLADERGAFIDGANDNASAVACVLGIGQQLTRTPLRHTEVWLAFTGSEEVGHFGLRAVLDKYSPDLRDAWCLDFELVGAGEIVYVTRHGSLNLFSAYRPDEESLALAARTARQHPDLNVRGQDVVILEEVATLLRYGHRGLCLVGVDEAGWLINWHQETDIAAHIDPAPLERAARFAWAMMQAIDGMA